jgi:peptide/nickel transport system permease protein
MNSRRYLIRKVLQALLTLAFVLVFNFFLFRVLPGDPAKLLVRQGAARLSAPALHKLEHDFGIDRPLADQFGLYVSETLRGNLGISFIFHQPVSSVIGSRVWPTVLLVGLATIGATIIGVLIGIYGAWRRGSRFDVGSLGFALVTYAMPEFWLGIILLILLATTTGAAIFPTGGYATPGAGFTGIHHIADVANHLVLPALTLILALLGQYALIMRSSLLDVMNEDYVTTARAKGLREALVLRRHVVPNALLPVVTLVALNLGFVVSGAITVETVFSWPGLGLLTYQALNANDYPLLQGLFLLASASVIFANLCADLLYGSLDPRVREA